MMLLSLVFILYVMEIYKDFKQEGHIIKSAYEKGLFGSCIEESIEIRKGNRDRLDQITSN